MSKKDKFIKEIEELLKEHELSQDAMVFFEALKVSNVGNTKETFTENGKNVLIYMREHFIECNNLFKAKDIAEALGVSSRTVSGGMRKLASDGYVEKIEGSAPVIYSITEEGKNVNLE